MSGTSRDGIDAALIETDGERRATPLCHAHIPYEREFADRLAGACVRASTILQRDWRDEELADTEQRLTALHAEAVRELLGRAGVSASSVDRIGFHGHTLAHRPQERLTVQLGDGQRLADLTGIDVIFDLRANDVAAGGQGAPLVPAYHLALAAGRDLPRPLAFLNIGGVANVTWIGANDRLIAFDTGPGNALIDDWVRRHTGAACDHNGGLASRGVPDEGRLALALKHPFFVRQAPKSLDRDDFGNAWAEGLSAADGAATLTEFTARAIALSLRQMPRAPMEWIVCGGGANNPALRQAIMNNVPGRLQTARDIGLNGDGLEAEAFAYLAVRSSLQLAITWPETTRAPRPMSGGRLATPNRAASAISQGQ